MCRFCDHLSKTSIPHTPIECKFRKSFYCPVCAAYGHYKDICPNKTAWCLRNNISPSSPLWPKEGNLLLLVEDTDDAIKKKLKQYGLPFQAGKEKNKSLLRDLAICMNPPRLLLFAKPK